MPLTLRYGFNFDTGYIVYVISSAEKEEKFRSGSLTNNNGSETLAYSANQIT
jgi:hypothetical protein